MLPFAFVIKIITFLYPFLKEILVGKYSNSKYHKQMKMAIIVCFILSIVLNVYLVKSSVELSKSKIANSKKISSLELEIQGYKKVMSETKLPIACEVPLEDKPKPKPEEPDRKPQVGRREDDGFADRLHKKLRYIERMED